MPKGKVLFLLDKTKTLKMIDFIKPLTSWPESCLAVIHFRINNILKRMAEAKGMDKIKVIQEYKAKATQYNDITGRNDFDLNYTC